MSTALMVTKQILKETDEICEIRYELENTTQDRIWLDEFEVFHADSLSELGVTEENCILFRSGRHKNDMPSVARFGRLDDCMKDALGGMTEAGERNDNDDAMRTIISDHLTVLGNESGYCMLGFITGRNQLFQTDIQIDNQGDFVALSSKVLFQKYLLPGQRVQTEILRIEHTKDIFTAIERFAMDKAALYGSRNGNPLSVFCTWYYYGLTVTYEDVLTNLERMEQLKLPFDVFQVDEGWEITLGEWEPNEKFPVPM